MKKLLGSLTAVLVLFLALPARSAGDEILEAARKEKARREELRRKRGQKPAETKTVLTNEELRRATADARGVSEVTPHHQPAAGAPSAEGTAAEDAAGSGEKPAGEAGAAAGAGAAGAASGAGGKPQGEEYWRGRLSEANAAVSKAQSELAELNQRINELRRGVSAIDDPQVRLGQEQQLRAAEADLPRAQQAVQEAQKGVARVREEARQAGASPGWLR